MLRTNGRGAEAVEVIRAAIEVGIGYYDCARELAYYQGVM